MNYIDITVHNREGLLELEAASKMPLTQFDNEAQVLRFQRPEEFAEHDLILYCSDGKTCFIPVKLGRMNEFSIPNSLTTRAAIFLQIAYEKDGVSQRSGKLELRLRSSIETGFEPALEWPDPLRELMENAISDIKQDGNCIRFYNLEKEEVAHLNVGEDGKLAIPGEAGAKGDKGDPGEAGAKGDRGDPGEAGAKGDKGDPGGAGAKGDKGDPGEAGAKGDKGDPGEVGVKGDKGDPGNNADASAAIISHNSSGSAHNDIRQTVAAKANLSGADFTGKLQRAGNIVWDADNFMIQNGSWTPTAFGSTTAGTPSYGVRDGYYTVIGSLVWINFRFAVSLAGASGNFIIGGLPFTAVGAAPTSGVISQALNMPLALLPHAFQISGSNISLPHPTENRLIHANEVTVQTWFYGTAVYRRLV